MLLPAECRSSRVIRPAIGSLVALTLLGPVVPAPAAEMRVTPARQAERDTLRRQILAHELSTEEQALAGAEARLAERTAAKDPQGVREAEDARRIHARNLDALRAEVARTRGAFVRTAVRPSGGGSDADRLRRTASRSNSASATEAVSTAAGPSPRWWNVYDAPATGSPPTTHAWNVYQGGPTP
jgi:hypothetical protein